MSIPLITSSLNPTLPLVGEPATVPEKDSMSRSAKAAFAKLRADLLQSGQGCQSSNTDNPDACERIRKEIKILLQQSDKQQLNNEEHIAEQKIACEIQNAEIASYSALHEAVDLRYQHLKDRYDAINDCCTGIYLLFYNTAKKIYLLLKTIFCYLFPCLCQDDVSGQPELIPQMNDADLPLDESLLDEHADDSMDLHDQAAQPTDILQSGKRKELQETNEQLRAYLGLVDEELKDEKDPKKINVKELRSEIINLLNQQFTLEQNLIELDQKLLENISEVRQNKIRLDAYAENLDLLERKIIFVEEMDLFTPYVILAQTIWGCFCSFFEGASSPAEELHHPQINE